MAASHLLTLALIALTIQTCASYDPPAKPPDMDCTFKDEASGTTYDLTDLMALNPGITQDRISTDNADYRYTFGVCSTVEAPKECRNSDGSSRVSHYWAPAWQTKISEENQPVTGSTTCFYLGNPDWKEHAGFSLYDSEDPAAGVSLQYDGGQSCHSRQLRRKIKFNFRCATNSIEKFEKNIIDEAEHCGYEVTVDTKLACPKECGFGSGNSPCGDHGVCGYDSDRKASRCFCNDGYKGGGCGDTTTATDDYGAILGLLIFVVIALVALAGGGIFMFRYLQKRTLSADGDSYSKLDNSFGDGLVENASNDGPTRMGVGVSGPSNI